MKRPSVFGLDFEKDSSGKPSSKGIKDIFDFETEWLMNIIPREDSRGTGVVRKKRISQGAFNLINDIKQHAKRQSS